ncbi:hypothetical protein CPter91_4358 [Collimonas pratensis]|uniref:Uncharacterized protein n=1 Tax=Collimonas pratensis TaxID=279113 RepID=A0A127Q9F1_9BURK|nr:hypothetical protein CPter91_4358 [Collimonas pratensis]
MRVAMAHPASYMKPFSVFAKKQHKPFQAVIEDEAGQI